MKKYLPLILIIISIAIFFAFIDPQFEEVQKLNKQKRDNDNMLQLAEELQRRRELLQSAYNNIGTEERKQLEKLLPDTVDNVRLVLDINNIAEEYGISIQNIEISKDSPDANQSSTVASSVERATDIGTIRFGFTVTSNYEIFINFMKDLEETLRIVDIRSLNIRQGQGSSMIYQVVIDTYWLR
jgi:Tfp pilus assembly protein PilO